MTEDLTRITDILADMDQKVGVIADLLEKQEERMTRAEPCEADEWCKGDEFRKSQIFVDQLNHRTRTLANEVYGDIASTQKRHSDLIGQLLDSHGVTLQRRVSALENLAKELDDRTRTLANEFYAYPTSIKVIDRLKELENKTQVLSEKHSEMWADSIADIDRREELDKRLRVLHNRLKQLEAAAPRLQEDTS